MYPWQENRTDYRIITTLRMGRGSYDLDTRTLLDHRTHNSKQQITEYLVPGGGN